MMQITSYHEISCALRALFEGISDMFVRIVGLRWGLRCVSEFWCFGFCVCGCVCVFVDFCLVSGIVCGSCVWCASEFLGVWMSCLVCGSVWGFCVSCVYLWNLFLGVCLWILCAWVYVRWPCAFAVGVRTTDTRTPCTDTQTHAHPAQKHATCHSFQAY